MRSAADKSITYGGEQEYNILDVAKVDDAMNFSLLEKQYIAGAGLLIGLIMKSMSNSREFKDMTSKVFYNCKNRFHSR